SYKPTRTLGYAEYGPRRGGQRGHHPHAVYRDPRPAAYYAGGEDGQEAGREGGRRGGVLLGLGSRRGRGGGAGWRGGGAGVPRSSAGAAFKSGYCSVRTSEGCPPAALVELPSSVRSAIDGTTTVASMTIQPMQAAYAARLLVNAVVSPAEMSLQRSFERTSHA